jgi:PAS domain-containing protein
MGDGERLVQDLPFRVWGRILYFADLPVPSVAGRFVAYGLAMPVSIDLTAVLDGMAEAIVVVDREGRIVYANGAMRRARGGGSEGAASSPW